MTPKREDAKLSITDRAIDDPELDATLIDAADLRHKLQLSQEDHRHKEEILKTELGVVGRIVGSESSAAVTAALIVVFFGGVSGIGCLVFAAYNPSGSSFWGQQSERSFAIVLAALGFIFGKGVSRPRK